MKAAIGMRPSTFRLYLRSAKANIAMSSNVESVRGSRYAQQSDGSQENNILFTIHRSRHAATLERGKHSSHRCTQCSWTMQMLSILFARVLRYPYKDPSRVQFNSINFNHGHNSRVSNGLSELQLLPQLQYQSDIITHSRMCIRTDSTSRLSHSECCVLQNGNNQKLIQCARQLSARTWMSSTLAVIQASCLSAALMQ